MLVPNIRILHNNQRNLNSKKSTEYKVLST